MTEIIAAARTGRSNTDIAADHDPRLRFILLASFLAGFTVLSRQVQPSATPTVIRRWRA